MIGKWETQQERLRRVMKISPQQKLEWLKELNEFNEKYLPKKTKLIRRKLRERRKNF